MADNLELAQKLLPARVEKLYNRGPRRPRPAAAQSVDRAQLGRGPGVRGAGLGGA